MKLLHIDSNMVINISDFIKYSIFPPPPKKETIVSVFKTKVWESTSSRGENKNKTKQKVKNTN